jgi:hypothetical protein
MTKQLLLIAALSLGLAGCAGNQPVTANPPTEKPASPPPSPSPTPIPTPPSGR